MQNFFTNLSKCMIIAEIGVNHNGDLSLAKEMIDSAKSAGADAVKFQTFKAENLVSKGTPKVKYQQNTTSPDETHYEMIKKLELLGKITILLRNIVISWELNFFPLPMIRKVPVF